MTTRVALVTGGNRGIGLEICRQLAKLGLDVVMTSRRLSAGEEARAKLGDLGKNITVVECDVTSQESIERCVLGVIQKKGRIDVLVNNAGILIDSKSNERSFFEASVATVSKTLETNTFGPMLMMQAVIPHMKKNKYGRVVNMSSGMGQLSEMNGGFVGYRMSKAGLNVLTRIVADELGSEPILVNSMCPGWVKTDMGGEGATLGVEEGADTAIWLATLPDNGPRGGFFRARKPIPW